MANSWFRMYSEFATDPKVQMMSEVMQRRLTMLFCLKNSNALRNGSDNDGNEEVAFMLRINDTELNETKALFISKGFIDSDWNLLNWDKRQFISDLDPTRAERQKRYREKHSNASRNAPVTPLDTDTDTDTEKNVGGDSNISENKKNVIDLKIAAPPPPTDFIYSSQKFSMFPEWEPSENFETLAKIAGMPLGDEYPVNEFLEFRSYWITQQLRQRTQGEWEHAFITNCKIKKSKAM